MFDPNFISPKLTRNNLDRYLIRTCILDFINNESTLFTGNLLDIGCGKMPYKEYILEKSSVTSYTGLDIESAIVYDSSVKAHFTWDGTTMPFNNNEYETAFGTEVLEHCPYPKIILDEVFRVLKPNGVFFFTVPFLWNLHEAPHDEYRYTPYSLERLLIEAGFINIHIQPQGGWHAAMAQMLGLWVCRSPINERLRKYLKILILPVYKLLLKKDIKPYNFPDGSMITGLSGIAYKPL